MYANSTPYRVRNVYSLSFYAQHVVYTVFSISWFGEFLTMLSLSYISRPTDRPRFCMFLLTYLLTTRGILCDWSSHVDCLFVRCQLQPTVFIGAWLTAVKCISRVCIYWRVCPWLWSVTQCLLMNPWPSTCIYWWVCPWLWSVTSVYWLCSVLTQCTCIYWCVRKVLLVVIDLVTWIVVCTLPASSDSVYWCVTDRREVHFYGLYLLMSMSLTVKCNQCLLMNPWSSTCIYWCVRKVLLLVIDLVKWIVCMLPASSDRSLNVA